MGEDLKDSVVVITGASSGIGRAAALAFAGEGARLVLAARRRLALDEVAGECEGRGGQALVVVTDVSDERAVETLAQRAIDTFGRIDVWVNNAAVSLFAPFEEAPPEVFRRVIETNFFGYVHGARSALRCFREQGRGVLVNVSSMVASAPQPYTSAYVASKYAIRGLSECLRMELSLDDGADIHVCHLMPASIDTPLFQQAANYTGRAVKALDPVIPPERVAASIVAAARNPKAETMIGGAGRIAASQHALAPRLFERMGARMVHRGHFQERPAEPTEGNLFVPMPEYASIHGGWSTSGSNGNRMGRVALGTAAVAVPLALWAWKRRGT